jgi:hypothetical protein
MFVEFSSVCSEEYFTFRHFLSLTTMDDPNSTIGSLPVHDIINFILAVRNAPMTITQEFISEFFDEFIRARLKTNPWIIEDIYPSLSKKQKKDFRKYLKVQN